MKPLDSMQILLLLYIIACTETKRASLRRVLVTRTQRCVHLLQLEGKNFRSVE